MMIALLKMQFYHIMLLCLHDDCFTENAKQTIERVFYRKFYSKVHSLEPNIQLAIDEQLKAQRTIVYY